MIPFWASVFLLGLLVYLPLGSSVVSGAAAWKEELTLFSIWGR